MTIERGLRLMAGIMVLLSFALAHYFSLLLAMACGFRGAQPLAIGFYQLVPRHGYPARYGTERCQFSEVASKLCAPGFEADESGMRFTVRCSGWKQRRPGAEMDLAIALACAHG